MTNPESFRPKANWLFFGVAVVVALGLVFAVASEGDSQMTAAVAAYAMAFVSAVYLAYGRPKVTVFDEGILIVNPLVAVTIGWQDVEDIDTRFSLSVQYAGKRINAAAAPAPGRHHARTVHPNELKGVAIPMAEAMRPGDSPRSDSGVAAHLARSRWAAFQKGGITGAAMQVEVNRMGVALPAVAFALGMLLQFLHL